MRHFLEFKSKESMIRYSVKSSLGDELEANLFVDVIRKDFELCLPLQVLPEQPLD